MTMTEQPEPLSPVDVIRCVYLARETARRGQPEAATRWAAKVECWLKRKGNALPPGPGMAEPEAP